MAKHAKAQMAATRLALSLAIRATMYPSSAPPSVPGSSQMTMNASVAMPLTMLPPKAANKQSFCRPQREELATRTF